MLDYAVFFLVQFALLFFSRLTKNSNFRILACIIAIGFCGLRFETGYDYNSYRSFFENIWLYEGVIEPGFEYFVRLGNALEMHTFAFFFLFALITHGIAFYTLNKVSANPDMAILLYLLIPGLYLNSFSVVRSSLALSIFAYAAVKLINNRSKFKYFSWGLLASSFHLTAVLPFFVAFIIYLNPKTNPSRLLCFVLLSISLFIGMKVPLAQTILNEFSATKFSVYVEWDVSQGAIKIFAMNLLASLIIYHVKYFKASQQSLYFFKIWFVGMLIFNVFIDFTPVTRVTYYFSIFSIPLLISSVAVYRLKFHSFINSALLLFFSAAFIAALYNDSMALDPLIMSNYKTIFEAP